MTEHVATYVQIASIIVYVFTALGLYKLLTSQKDAVIQTLKEQIELLKIQNKQLESNTPDVLSEILSKRALRLNEELAFLKADNDATIDKITAKEQELKVARQDLARLHKQVTQAEETLESYTCPKCGSLMRSREFKEEAVEVDGFIEDHLHEHITYYCGYELLDGKETDAKCVIDDFEDLTLVSK